MTKNLTKILCVVLLTFVLAACGEGGEWERKLTKTHFPYGNQRTAGSGVAYVLAKMMPEKSLKLEDVKPAEPKSSMVSVDRKIKPAVIQNPVIKSVQETLDKTLRK